MPMAVSVFAYFWLLVESENWRLRPEVVLFFCLMICSLSLAELTGYGFRNKRDKFRRTLGLFLVIFEICSVILYGKSIQNELSIRVPGGGKDWILLLSGVLAAVVLTTGTMVQVILMRMESRVWKLPAEPSKPSKTWILPSGLLV